MNRELKKMLLTVGAISSSAFGWCLASFMIIWTCIYGLSSFIEVLIGLAGVFLIWLGGKLFMKAMDELTK